MKATEFDIIAPSLESAWLQLDKQIVLRPICDEVQYRHAVVLMNSLIDRVGDSIDHPLAGLLDLVSDLIFNYEMEHVPIPVSDPHEMLGFLIEMAGGKRSDLDEIVSAADLSAILAGRKEISVSLATRLAEHFSVSRSLFIAS